MSARGHGRWAPVGLAVALALPSLWVGLQFDDFAHRAALKPASGPIASHADGDRAPKAIGPGAAMMGLFTFLDGDPSHARAAMDSGALPWWTLPNARQSFWRPLAAFTHWLDYGLWPDHPWLMHAHSLLWFAALIAAAGAMYRSMYRSTNRPLPPLGRAADGNDAVSLAGAAGLATFLYAVDGAHGFAVGWLANRNALMAALFGVLCVRSHVRGRRDGRRLGGAAAPAWLALALLSAEAATATVAYLAAYAICLDRGGCRRRLGALLPSFLVLLVWATIYRALGFGAWGTAYMDPLAEPLHFARAVATRAPLLLLGQWGLPPAEVAPFLSPTARRWLWLAAWLVLGGLARLLVPTLRQSATARFWAIGMLLAVIPSCAALPANRLLFFVGLGAMGLLAELLAGMPAVARSRRTRAGVRVLAAIHLGLAPAQLSVASLSPALVGGIGRASLGVPLRSGAHLQTAVFVNAPSFFSTGLLRMIRSDHGLTQPARVRYLGAGPAALDVSRVDARTLVVRPAGGYLGGFDSLFRGPDHPMTVGQKVVLEGVTVSVLDRTPDGRPARVGFRFSVSLEDPLLSWFAWREGAFVPFDVPAVGRTRHLAASLPLGLLEWR